MELHFVFHMVLKSPKMSHLKVELVIFTNNWKRFFVENWSIFGVGQKWSHFGGQKSLNLLLGFFLDL